METAQTADYALRVLNELAHRSEQTATELSKALDINRAVLQRIVATLHARALITRTIDNRYLLGPGLIVLGSGLQHELARIARLPLLLLAEACAEAVVLSVPAGDDVEVIAARNGNHGPLRIEYSIGFRHSITVGASGLAMLAYLPPETRNRLLPAQADRLDGIREAGYALTTGEIRDFMVGLAVPVLMPDNEVIGSLAVVTPTARANGILSSLPQLQSVAADLGRELAHIYETHGEQRLTS